MSLASWFMQHRPSRQRGALSLVPGIIEHVSSALGRHIAPVTAYYNARATGAPPTLHTLLGRAQCYEQCSPNRTAYVRRLFETDPGNLTDVA